MGRWLEPAIGGEALGIANRGEELAGALDRTVAEALQPILLALSLVYLFLAPIHLLVLGGEAGQELGVAAGVTGVLFLLALALNRTFSLSRRRGHLWGLAVVGMVLANAFLGLHLTGEPRQTVTVLLAILGVGLLFLDRGWFSVAAVLTLGGWGLVAVPRLPDPDWIHFGGVLLLGTGLSGTVLVVRRRSLVRLEALRLQERVQQIELESALDQTERARRGGEEAQRAMETAMIQVKESEERFRRLAEATFEGVVFYREGKILDANPRAARDFGVAVSQMVGDPVLNLLAHEDRDRARDLLLAPPDPGDPARADSMEVSARRYDGSFFPVEISVVDSLYQGHAARVLVFRDVTNQKEAERMLRRALEEAEANSRAKSTFLANMSHELRTPLNSVIGFANILRRKAASALPEKELDYLTRIQANGEHLLSLIEDILDLSKIDAQRMELEPQPVDLGGLAEEVVKTLDLQARRKGLYLVTEISEELDPVEADPRRLRQVLLNLAGNAVKFTSAGGVTIRVVPSRDGRRPLRLEVEDTGMGIPAPELEEIFVPFHQVDASHARSFGGTGLGLAISRSLCDLMGFELHARSREGEGSIFILDLGG